VVTVKLSNNFKKQVFIFMWEERGFVKLKPGIDEWNVSHCFFKSCNQIWKES